MTTSNLERFTSTDEIFRICMNKFNSLPRTGKPNEKEWTVLSCILEYNHETKQTKVVSLGTGTKCIGKDQMCSKGFTLNDSHAEVMARRGFLRYLYQNMMNFSNSAILTFCQERKKYRIKEEISYHFFSTHAPCGDATIVSKLIADEPSNKRMKLSDDCSDNFTGAKLLSPGTNPDLMSQDEGALRTKPGRGVRTLSMSCSDKISRWNILGIQGALLDVFLDAPVYLKTFTFCGNVDERSLKRAIYERFTSRTFTSNRYQIQIPVISVCSSNLNFEFMQKLEKDPSPASIVWCDVQEKPLEVTVSGKRQGVTKSKRDQLSGALRISKQWLLREFHTLMTIQPVLLEYFNKSTEEVSELNYEQLKYLCEDYQSAWQSLKDYYFLDWTKKPKDLLKFKLESK